MANGSSRFLGVLVSLIIGFAVGWFVHTAPTPAPPPPPPQQVTPSPSPQMATPTPTPPPPGDWDVAIGDDPCDLSDPLVVVQVGKNKIKWHSRSGRKIYVILHMPPCSNPNSDPPFANAYQVGTANGMNLWAIGNGGTASIDSGKVNANQCPSGSNPIKYDQYIQVAPHSNLFRYCDGWIIIKP